MADSPRLELQSLPAAVAASAHNARDTPMSFSSTRAELVSKGDRNPKDFILFTKDFSTAGDLAQGKQSPMMTLSSIPLVYCFD